MAGLVLIAAGLLLAGVDFEGDFSLQWWPVVLLLIVAGAVLRLGGPLMATPEQDARFSAIDEAIDAGMVPGRGAVASGDAATSGGVSAPAGSHTDGAVL